MVAASRAGEILEVASRLFYEQGYRGVSMRALAQEAGIQGGSLYHHFPSKEEMLYRISLYGSQGFFAELSPLLKGPGSFTERLDAFVRAYVVHYHRRRHPIAVLFKEGANLSPAHAEELRAVRRRFQQGFQRFLAAGVEAGEFRLPDPRLAGIAVLDMLNGVDGWMRSNGRLGVDEVAGAYAALVLQLAGARRRRSAGRRADSV